MSLDELLSELKHLQYKYDDSNYSFDVIEKNQFYRVEALIRQFLLDNHDAENGELKAKVYAYEKIIANSNFAPVIEKHRNTELKSFIKEFTEYQVEWLLHNDIKCDTEEKNRMIHVLQNMTDSFTKEYIE